MARCAAMDVKSKSIKIDIIRMMKLLAMILLLPMAAYAFGWDCGRWFCRDRDANKTEEASA